MAALWQGLNILVSLAVIRALFTLLLEFLPDARVTWRASALGAALTTVLFTVGKEPLGLYLGRSSVASAYGAAGSLAVILLWVYYSAQIFLFGAAFTRAFAERSGQRVQPAEGAISTECVREERAEAHAGAW
jgi:membrane protein